MLRFQPDSWLEGFLRPLLLADPVAGLYFEAAAPDWRFALFIVFMTIALGTRHARSKVTAGQAVAAAGLVTMMYVWTFVTGNGRYFIWGLVLVGPLLVMAGRLLPGSLQLKVSLLGLVAAIQLFTVMGSYSPNVWGIVPVDRNPAPLDDSPLRHEPAVFLTMSAISFSALVPRFHPESRWAGIGGQHVILVGSPEHRRLLDLLASPLPKYLVLPLDRRAIAPSGQIRADMANLVAETLAPYSLSPTPGGCSFLNSPLSRVSRDQAADGSPPQPGFWLCRTQADPGAGTMRAQRPDPAARYADVFERIEKACPRFFPPSKSRPVHAEDSIGQFYPITDVRVLVDQSEEVFFKYFRAMNPTRIGSVADIRRGDFTLPCDKLPGRYLPPWDRN